MPGTNIISIEPKSPPTQLTYNPAPNMISNNNSVVSLSMSPSNGRLLVFDDEDHDHDSTDKKNEDIDINVNNNSKIFSRETLCTILPKL